MAPSCHRCPRHALLGRLDAHSLVHELARPLLKDEVGPLGTVVPSISLGPCPLTRDHALFRRDVRSEQLDELAGRVREKLVRELLLDCPLFLRLGLVPAQLRAELEGRSAWSATEQGGRDRQTHAVDFVAELGVLVKVVAVAAGLVGAAWRASRGG